MLQCVVLQGLQGKHKYSKLLIIHSLRVPHRHQEHWWGYAVKLTLVGPYGKEVLCKRRWL